MNVLITGASGFIGSHLACMLLDAGHSVCAQHRRPDLPSRLRQPRAGLRTIRQAFNFQGQDTQLAQICRQACKALRVTPSIDHKVLEQVSIPLEWQAQAETLAQGCDSIIHVAASTGDWGSTDAFLEANVYPTLALLDYALRHSLRFVYVSSIAVHGFTDHCESTELGPYAALNNPYPTTKRLAEVFCAIYRQRGLDLRVVRPGNVYGPGDTTVTFPMFDAMEKGLMGTLGKGRFLTCPIHVTDLCKGIYRALEAENPKEYLFNFTSPEKVTWAEYTAIMAQSLNLPVPKTNLPVPIARFVGAFLEAFARLCRWKNPPPLTRYRVVQVTSNYHFNCQRAYSILGWQATIPLSQGMRETAQDYRASVGKL